MNIAENRYHFMLEDDDITVEQIPDFFPSSSTSKPKKRLRFGRCKSNVIVRNAGHIVPFSPEIAYEKFSDFSRHPEWNPNIQSASYIDSSKTKVRWTRDARGFSIGWTTVTTVQERNKSLAWKSIDGIKTENRVIFQSVDNGRGTLMIMSSSYKVPEKVFNPSRKMIGKSTLKQKRALNHTKECPQIKNILERFCEAVTIEQERAAMYFM